MLSVCIPTRLLFTQFILKYIIKIVMAEPPTTSAQDSKSKRPLDGDDDVVTPITAEGEMPKKKFYRSRAHCNPLSHNDTFEYPMDPSHMDWSKTHYPSNTPPTVLDIGCGFGGLTGEFVLWVPVKSIVVTKNCRLIRFLRMSLRACFVQHTQWPSLRCCPTKPFWVWKSEPRWRSLFDCELLRFAKIIRENTATHRSCEPTR
jgi:hypothetical protein